MILKVNHKERKKKTRRLRLVGNTRSSPVLRKVRIDGRGVRLIDDEK